MADVRKSGFSEYKPYDYEAESKKGKAKKKEKTNKDAKTAEDTGKAAKVGGEVAGFALDAYGEPGAAEAARKTGDYAEKAGKGVGTGIKAANSDSLTETATYTMAMAGEANKTYQDATSENSVFTEAGQNKAYADAAKKEGETAAELTAKNEKYIERQKKKNPDAFGSDGSIKDEKVAKRVEGNQAKVTKHQSKQVRYTSRAEGGNKTGAEVQAGGAAGAKAGSGETKKA